MVSCLDSVVHAARKNEVSRLREPPNSSNSLIVALPDMNLFLGYETFGGGRIRPKIHPNVMRCVKEVSTLVIHRIVDCNSS